MKSLWNFFGGRKLTLIYAAFLVFLLRELVGISDELAREILWYSLGGAGVVALEDSAGKLLK